MKQAYSIVERAEFNRIRKRLHNSRRDEVCPVYLKPSANSEIHTKCLPF
jgi:hypothetical protein